MTLMMMVGTLSLRLSLGTERYVTAMEYLEVENENGYVGTRCANSDKLTIKIAK